MSTETYYTFTTEQSKEFLEKYDVVAKVKIYLDDFDNFLDFINKNILVFYCKKKPLETYCIKSEYLDTFQAMKNSACELKIPASHIEYFKTFNAPDWEKEKQYWQETYERTKKIEEDYEENLLGYQKILDSRKPSGDFSLIIVLAILTASAIFFLCEVL